MTPHDPPATSPVPMSAPPLATQRPHSALRSLLIGSIGVAAMCALAPYNDSLRRNTVLIGGYLPLAVVLAIFLLVVMINAPLHRFAPRQALTSRELAVILAMLLAGSAVATQGLLRFWLPMLVAPFQMGQSDPTFWKAFVGADLPWWVFPVEVIAG